MAKEIIRKGATKYTAHCGECSAVFTYEREDVHQNYVRGSECVSCPSCGHDCRHLGADATAHPHWPHQGFRGLSS